MPSPVCAAETLPAPGFPADSAEVKTFLLVAGDREVEISFVPVNGALVSQRCFQAGHCLTLDKLNGPHPVMNLALDGYEHLAESYCNRLGGHPLTLWEADRSSSSFCLFDDRSLINSWELYARYQTEQATPPDANTRSK